MIVYIDNTEYNAWANEWDAAWCAIGWHIMANLYFRSMDHFGSRVMAGLQRAEARIDNTGVDLAKLEHRLRQKGL